ncbi:MAG: 30S ribosomal protein S3 [bacterium]|nr:30S ribosomal protein S3 [bacterium]
MGQKVHPIGFRVGLDGSWLSKWYAPSKEFGSVLLEDLKIRELVKKKLFFAGVSRIRIERVTDRIRVTVATARPGLVIGRRGGEIDKLRDEIQGLTGREVFMEIEEVKRPETEAQLVAENVAQQLEKRASFKRVIKRAAQTAMDFGAQGVRIKISGRLGGAEIARSEQVRMGKLPLHTLRADIDYGFAEARTTYGCIGCKVWICRGVGRPEREEGVVRGGVGEVARRARRNREE